MDNTAQQTDTETQTAYKWWRSLSINEQNLHANAWLAHAGLEVFRPFDVQQRPHWVLNTYQHAQKASASNLQVWIDVSPDCAAAVLSLPNWRVWQTQVGRPAVSYGGMDEEAKEAVQAALAERYVGDWDLSVNRATSTDRTPCAWCKRHERYAH